MNKTMLTGFFGDSDNKHLKKMGTKDERASWSGKPTEYEKKTMKRIKVGDKRCRGVMDVCWQVISLRPFKILVISDGGRGFEAETTKWEFINFGEEI